MTDQDAFEAATAKAQAEPTPYNTKLALMWELKAVTGDWDNRWSRKTLEAKLAAAYTEMEGGA
jgi:protein involved in temperature-dependent protein secretion